MPLVFDSIDLIDYQAGPKGRNLEVGARRAPRLLVLVIWSLSSISSSYVVAVFIILVMVAAIDLITTRVQVQKETEDGMEDGVCGEVFTKIINMRV